MTLAPEVVRHQADIEAFCARHHIVRMWLFGSALRGDFGPDSDIDVLVQFDADHVPGWEFFGMADELAELLGRPVDFGTPNSLRPALRQQVLETAQLIYEAA